MWDKKFAQSESGYYMNKKKNKINNTSGVNQEAQRVIEQSIQREKEYKKKVVSELIQIINRVCDENNLQYFVMGRLLTWCVFGEDSYPETNQYFIGMLRKDYDLFLQKLTVLAEKNTIGLSLMYDPKGVVRSLNTYVSKKETFKDSLGRLEIEISLRIEPYDHLPDDDLERRQFMKKVAQKTRFYRARSRFYKSRREADGKGTGAKLRTLPFLLRMYHFFKKEKNKYGRLIRHYDKSEHPMSVGRIEMLNYPSHKLSEIYPITRSPFLNTELQIPSHTEEFMLLPQEEEEKKAASGRVETMRSFDQLCRGHGLSYVVMKDLAIACAHHADNWPGLEKKQWYVGMLRKDYQQAISLLRETETACGLIVKDTVNEYPFIKDSVTGIMKQEYAKRFPGEQYYLLYILPLDFVPEEYEESRSFLKKVSEAEHDFTRLIQYEKGVIWNKPHTELEDTWKQYINNQQLRCRYNHIKGIPEQVYTYSNDRIWIYPYNELFPVSDRSFHDFSVMCPVNPFYWHAKKDEEYTEYLAAERTKLLGVVDSLCIKNGISYFAIAQLLIGAMIYHNVVPESGKKMWDIGLLRTDYESLIQLLKDSGEKYGLELHEYLDREKKYYSGTGYVTFAGGKYSDVKIRLLPFDKVPEDFYLFQGFMKELDQRNEDYMELIARYKAGNDFRHVKEDIDEDKKKYLQSAVPSEEAKEINKLAQIFNDDERTHSYRRIAFGKSKLITKKELFPLQRVKFRDIEINCPHDTSVWQPVLDSELERQVSKIQEADLLLIQEFDRVCNELGLGYFICGGTMLGYMRHGGFIPWDDDVDCAMLRADYDRFIAEAGPLLKDKFFLQTRETDPNIPYLFTKIRLDDTEYITKYNENRDFHKGICLDIFPFDFLPNDLEERESFVEEVISAAKRHHHIADHQYPIPENNIKARNSKEEQYIEEQKSRLKRFWDKDLRVSQKEYLDIATRYNDRAKELGLKTVGSFVPSYTYIDLKDLLPYQRGTFEGLNVSTPKRPDVFLKMQYGDYMKLPPRHGQVAHRLERWATWEECGSRYPDNEV